MKPEKKWCVNPEIIYKSIDETVYILDHRDATIHTLNETASFIWLTLLTPQTLPALSTQLASEFAVTASQAKKDCKAFVQTYVAAGYLIEVE